MASNIPKNAYVPGVCNIGPAQIRVRWIFGGVGAAFTLITWALLRRYGYSAAWYWTLVVPTSAAAIGCLQAYEHFCANFGLKGVFNMDKTITSKDTPIQAKYRAEDQQKALQIIFYSIVIGTILAALAVFLA